MNVKLVMIFVKHVMEKWIINVTLVKLIIICLVVTRVQRLVLIIFIRIHKEKKYVYNAQ